MASLNKKVVGLIFAILFISIGLYMGDTVVDTVQGINTDDWTFTGYEAVENVIDLFPLIYYASVMIGFIGMLYVITRGV